MSFSEFDIEEKLKSFYYKDSQSLSSHNLEKFASLIKSVARESILISQISKKTVTADLIDINHINFNPMALAIWHYQKKNIEEACWILFLCSYIGKSINQDWNLLKNIYSSLGDSKVWTLKRLKIGNGEFKIWLKTNQALLNKKGKLGYIYKEPSFSPYRATVMVNDIESYVDWVSSYQLSNIIKDKSSITFDQLYQSMKKNVSFHNLIIFDFLSLLENIGISTTAPENLYLNEILLSKKTAKLLVYGEIKNQKISVWDLNECMVSLAQHLDLPFSFKILQTALMKFGVDKYWSKNQNYRRPYNR